MTIYKFTLQCRFDVQTIGMPVGCRILKIAYKDGAGVCIWGVCDPNAEMETKTFHVVGTGEPIPEGMVWLETVVVNRMVYHIFGEVEL